METGTMMWGFVLKIENNSNMHCSSMIIAVGKIMINHQIGGNAAHTGKKSSSKDGDELPLWILGVIIASNPNQQNMRMVQPTNI